MNNGDDHSSSSARRKSKRSPARSAKPTSSANEDVVMTPVDGKDAKRKEPETAAEAHDERPSKMSRTDNAADAATASSTKQQQQLEMALFRDPNIAMETFPSYYTQMEPFLEWRLVKWQHGARKGDYKIVLVDRRDPKANRAVSMWAPIGLSVLPEGPPFGDWKTTNEKMKQHRTNQTVPIEAQLKLQLGVKKWHEAIQDPKDPLSKECPRCRDFCDRFVPEMLTKGVEFMVKNRDKIKEAQEWYTEYKGMYTADPKRTLDEFVVACIVNKLKKKNTIYTPTDKETKELMPQNRRAQFRAPVCSKYVPANGNPPYQQLTPELAANAVIAKIVKWPDAKDPKVFHKFNHYLILDPFGKPLPFEQSVIQGGDAVAYRFCMKIVQHSKLPGLNLDYLGALVYQRSEHKTEAQRMTEEVSVALPGAKALATVGGSSISSGAAAMGSLAYDPSLSKEAEFPEDGDND
jgi:hypothetical protein